MSPVVVLIGTKGAGKSYLAPTFSYAGSPLATTELPSASSKKSALDISIYELRPDDNLQHTIDQIQQEVAPSSVTVVFVEQTIQLLERWTQFAAQLRHNVGFIWNNRANEGFYDDENSPLQVTEIKTFDHDDHLAMTDLHQKMMRLVSQPVVAPFPSNDIITTVLNFVRNTVQANCGVLTAAPLRTEDLNQICSTLRSVTAKLKELAPNFPQLNLKSVATQFEMACKGLEHAENAINHVLSLPKSPENAVENLTIVSNNMQQASHIFEEILKIVTDTITAHQPPNSPNQQQQHSV